MSSSSVSLAKCILVIGATSGIGRSLAIALKGLPSKPVVIAAGRRRDRLDQLSKDHKLETIQVDINTDADGLKSFVDSTLKKYPDLDAVLFVSGVQYPYDFAHPEQINVSNISVELNVNYTSIVTMTTFFLPHLLQLHSQDRPTWIMPVSSALAFIHYPRVITYCATKVALHSFTASLRVQLRDTKINIIEIIPPLVESELHDAQGSTAALSKIWMPLDEYTTSTMAGLVRGDEQVMVESTAQYYERFEKAKMDALNFNTIF